MLRLPGGWPALVAHGRRPWLSVNDDVRPVGVHAVLRDGIDACESSTDCEGGADVVGGSADLAGEAGLHGNGDPVVISVLHFLRDEHGARVVTEAEVRNGLLKLINSLVEVELEVALYHA